RSVWQTICGPAGNSKLFRLKMTSVIPKQTVRKPPLKEWRLRFVELLAQELTKIVNHSVKSLENCARYWRCSTLPPKNTEPAAGHADEGEPVQDQGIDTDANFFAKQTN